MCLVLYLGLDTASPLIAPQDFSGVDSEDPSWPSKVVPFSVETLTEDNQDVACHFSTKVVRYAGSYEGCGCGFNACCLPEWEESAESDGRVLAGREAGRVSRRLLREYVEKHNVRQIYACWSGDEALHPTAHLDIEPERITDWAFEIPERAMLEVRWL